jgi:hypothetical protein
MGKVPTLDQLREELRRAFEETSARSVAHELGVAPSGLVKFVESPGATIYGKTLRKVRPWYRRRVAKGLSAPAAEDVANAVNVLSREMSPGEAERFRREIAGMLKAAYADRHGVEEAVNAASGE